VNPPGTDCCGKYGTWPAFQYRKWKSECIMARLSGSTENRL